MLAIKSVSHGDPAHVLVSAGDMVTRAGITSQLRGHAGLRLIDEADADYETIALVVVDALDDDALRSIRAMKRRGVERIVVVAARIDDNDVMAAVEAGASGLLRRADASGQSLANAVRAAAAGDGTVPPDLLGRLLGQLGLLQRHVLAPRGLTFSGLTQRELSVLRLLADGLDTAEVSRKLFYSERTVKNVLHDVTSRLGLRNRTHAVAYALRQGLI